MADKNKNKTLNKTITTKRVKRIADPEGLNDSRADWAQEALDTFRAATGTEVGDAVCDLLGDLLHWCDRNGQDFKAELKRALYHYEAETTPEDDKHRAGAQAEGITVDV